MKWRQWFCKKFLGSRLLDENTCSAILAIERVRIWEEIFRSSSVTPYSEPTKSGETKTTNIISLGEAKLNQIIFLPLPDNFPGVEKVLGFKELSTISEHPSLKSSLHYSIVKQRLN